MKRQYLEITFLGSAMLPNFLPTRVGSMVRKESDVRHPIENMSENFLVIPDHLVKLCDDVLSEKLSAESLQAIGFCLVASDHFEWGGDTDEGARVADTVLDWASPEINDDRIRAILPSPSKPTQRRKAVQE